jgi:hypothetical protein
MLPGAICGETVKRKTSEHDLDEELFEDEPIKMKGKAFRKLGDEDFY